MDEGSPLIGQDIEPTAESASEQKEPEPMDLDDDEDTTPNTILEVNNTQPKPTDPRLRGKTPPTASKPKAAQLPDDELVQKACMQLEALKQMEQEQERLNVARQKALDMINQGKLPSQPPPPLPSQPTHQAKVKFEWKQHSQIPGKHGESK